MSAQEYNFDAIVGPTHSYAGLAYGNVASTRNEGSPANPREAALQGLEKMRVVHELGIPQAVLPPHERPDTAALRRLGFSGDDAAVVAAAARQAPRLLAGACSASAMWAANAATVSPAADTADARVHFTPANLIGQFHRGLEPATTARVLGAIFADPSHFAHHDPLPAVAPFGDEGAANHTRLAANHESPGVELFVYGREGFARGEQPRRYPARQTLEASEAVARLHGLNASRTVFAAQNPAAVDEGVFHNDVIAVGNGELLLYHEAAFVDAPSLRERLQEAAGGGLSFIEVPAERVSLADAVDSYFFNSQLLTLPQRGMALLLPEECRQTPAVEAYAQELVAGAGPVCRLIYRDLRQSMRNGGGPACLRLRVVLDDAQAAAMAPGVRFDEALYERLRDWVMRHYRDRLAVADLADPALLEESRAALDELTAILGLGSLYPFQRCGSQAE